KDDLQSISNQGIAVDRLRNIVRQFDYQLGPRIVWRCLSREDFDARNPVVVRLGKDLPISRDRIQNIEQLALIFVNAFDLDIEQRAGVDVQPEALPNYPGEPHLVGTLDRCKTLLQRLVVCLIGEAAQGRRVIEDGRTAYFAQQAGERRIGL